MLINAALMGLGSVNRNLLTILARKAVPLQRDHGIGFRIVLVADSRGVAVDSAGFDPADIVARKAAGGSTADCRLSRRRSGGEPAGIPRASTWCSKRHPSTCGREDRGWP